MKNYIFLYNFTPTPFIYFNAGIFLGSIVRIYSKPGIDKLGDPVNLSNELLAPLYKVGYAPGVYKSSGSSSS